MRIKTPRSGRDVIVQIPPSVVPMIPAAVAEHEALEQFVARRESVADERASLLAQAEQAEADRADNIADAVLNGKALPTKDPVTAIRNDIAVADSRLEGIDQAIEIQTRKIVDAIEDERETALVTAEEQIGQAAAKLAKAADVFVALRHELDVAIENRDWVRDFPRAKTHWHPKAGPVALGNSFVDWPTFEAAVRNEATAMRGKVDATRVAIGGGGRMPVPPAGYKPPRSLGLAEHQIVATVESEE